MFAQRSVAVVGSRDFLNYTQICRILAENIKIEDILVSGGARGADSFAQRWAKDNGHSILIHYPNYERFGRGSTFIRNKKIVEDSDLVLAFYAKGRLGLGGTANTILWARNLHVPFLEFEEE